MLNEKMTKVVKDYLGELSSRFGGDPVLDVPTSKKIEFQNLLFSILPSLDFSGDKLIKLLNSSPGKYLLPEFFKDNIHKHYLDEELSVELFLYRMFFYQEYLRVAHNKDSFIEIEYADENSLVTSSNLSSLDVLTPKKSMEFPFFASKGQMVEFFSPQNPYTLRDTFKAYAWERGFKGGKPLTTLDIHPEIYLLGHYTKLYQKVE